MLIHPLKLRVSHRGRTEDHAPPAPAEAHGFERAALEALDAVLIKRHLLPQTLLVRLDEVAPRLAHAGCTSEPKGRKRRAAQLGEDLHYQLVAEVRDVARCV